MLCAGGAPSTLGSAAMKDFDKDGDGELSVEEIAKYYGFNIGKGGAWPCGHALRRRRTRAPPTRPCDRFATCVDVRGT